jgi:hypothetical protein
MDLVRRLRRPRATVPTPALLRAAQAAGFRLTQRLMDFRSEEYGT